MYGSDCKPIDRQAHFLRLRNLPERHPKQNACKSDALMMSFKSSSKTLVFSLVCVGPYFLTSSLNCPVRLKHSVARKYKRPSSSTRFSQRRSTSNQS